MKSLSVELIIEARDRASSVVRDIKSVFSGLGTEAKQAGSDVVAAGKDMERAEKTIANVREEAEKPWKAGEQDRFFNQIDTSFNEMETEAKKAAKVSREALEGAFSKLDMKSSTRLKAEINEIRRAYQKLADSGQLSASELATAEAKKREAIKRVTAAYREQRSAAVKAGKDGQTGFARLRGFIDQTRTSVGGLKAALLGVSTVLAGLGVGLMGAHVLETAASFEQLEKQLDTLTKGRGTETLRELNEWALEMPVNTQQAIATFKQMQAYGLDPTIEKLETLVDVSTLFGEEAMSGVARALGQMQTLGKVSAEELNQLSEAGINARKYLRDAFGMTVEEIQASGMEIETVIAAIMDGMKSDFGGAARAGQDAWAGLKNSVVSYVTEMERAVMDAGLFDWLKGKTRELVAWFKEWRESGDMERWAKRTSDFLISVGNAIVMVTKAVGNFLSEWGKVLASAAAVAGFVVTAKLVTGGLLSIAGAALSVVTGVGKLVTAFKMASLVMRTTLVGAAIVAVLGIVELIRKYNEWKQLQDQGVSIRKEPLRQEQELFDALNKRFNLEIKSSEDLIRLEKEKVLWQDEETGAWYKVGESLAGVAVKAGLTKKEWTKLKQEMKSLSFEYQSGRSDAADYFDYQISRVQALVDEEDRAAATVIALQSAKYLELMRLAEEEANKKLELLKKGEGNEKEYSQAAADVHKQLKEVKLEVMEEWASNLEEAVQTSLDMERKYADEVKRLQKEIQFAKMSTAEKLIELDRKLMSPGQRWEHERLEAVMLLEAAEKRLAEGTEEGMKAAEDLAKKAQDKFADLGHEVQDGETTVVSLNDAVGVAREGISKAGKVWEKALSGQTDQAKKAGSAWKDFGTTAQQQLGSIKDRMDQLSRAEIKPTVKVDDSDLDRVDNRIKKMDGSHIRVYVDEIPAANKAAGGPVYGPSIAQFAGGGDVFARLAAPYITRGSGTRDDVPAMLTKGEFVQTVSATRHYGLDVMYALRDRRIPREVLSQFLAEGGEVAPVSYYNLGGLVSALGTAVRKTTSNTSGKVDADAVIRAVLEDIAFQFEGYKGKLGEIPGGFTPRVDNLVTRISAIFTEAAASPGNASLTSKAQKQLEAERSILNQSSLEQANLAREMGFGSAADLIEMFRAEADALLVELQNALDDLRQEYETAVAELEAEKQDALAQAQEDFQTAQAEALSAQAEAQSDSSVDTELLDGLAYAKQSEANYRSNGWESERATGAANAFSSAVQLANQGEMTDELAELYKKYAWSTGTERDVYGAQIQQTLTRNREAARLQARADSIDASAPGAALGQAVQEAERTFQIGLESAARELTGEARQEGSSTLSEGRKLFTSASSDLRSSLMDTIQELSELLMDARKSLFELTKSYTSSNIGMSQWLEGDEETAKLALGGLVAPIRSALGFARGGIVPMVQGARRGVDSVLSVLTPEESVITAPRTRLMGSGLVDFINNGPLDQVKDFLMRGAGVMGFNGGGIVPGGAVPTKWSGELTFRKGKQSATVYGEPNILEELRNMLRDLEAAT